MRHYLVFRWYGENVQPDNSRGIIEREAFDEETRRSIIRELNAEGWELESSQGITEPAWSFNASGVNAGFCCNICGKGFDRGCNCE